MNPEVPRNPRGAARRQATVLESVEEIRAQVRAAAAAHEKEAEGRPVRQEDPDRDTQPFRPNLRPSMAILCALDDGEDVGELVRIRASSFVIGRVEGDLIIPHDGGISGRHAEISRRIENGESCWYLKDLNSTNGTFVRASTLVLHDGQELLIGSRRFRFESPASATLPDPAQASNATRKWEAVSNADGGTSAPPSLVEMTQGRVAHRSPLANQEQWLGRDPRHCSIVIDDPMVERRHARIDRDERTNRWQITNARSRNGLWARIQEVAMGRGGYFQCGEQRFSFKVL